MPVLVSPLDGKKRRLYNKHEHQHDERFTIEPAFTKEGDDDDAEY